MASQTPGGRAGTENEVLRTTEGHCLGKGALAWCGWASGANGGFQEQARLERKQGPDAPPPPPRRLCRSHEFNFVQR